LKATPAYQQQLEEYTREMGRYEKAVATCALFTLTPGDQEKIDTKMKDLSLCPKFVKASHVPFKTKTGSKHPKAADWYADT
jgi:hypothetical protein